MILGAPAAAADDELTADLRRWGAPPEEIERWTMRHSHDHTDLKILPECVPAVRLFIAMGTQWRRAGMSGIPTGLDYGVLPVVAQIQRRTLDRRLLTDLQVMERAALAAFVEARADK